MGHKTADQHRSQKSRHVSKGLRPTPPPPHVTQQPDGGDVEQDKGAGSGTDEMLISAGSPAIHMKPSIARMPLPEGVAASEPVLGIHVPKLPPVGWRKA